MNDGLQLQRRWLQYGFASSISILAGLAEFLLDRGRIEPATPFAAASAALVASACWAGPGPGLLSLCLVTVWTVLTLGTEGYAAGSIAVRCFVFLVGGLLLCAWCGRFRAAMERAAHSERWHRRLTETAAEGIQVTREDGVITYANPRMGEILGFTPQELMGRKTEEFLFPEEVPLERIRIRNRRDGVREQFDRRLRRKDGSEAWVLVSANSFRSEKGEFQGVLAMMTDITERKIAEQALRLSEAKFRGLFENVLEGVYQSTPDGRILAANPMLLRMLGLESEAEFENINIATDLYPDPKVRKQLLERLELDGCLQNVEYELRRRDGQIIRVLENARAVRGDDGRVLYYEGTLADITEKREIEDRLRNARQAEATGRMAGAIAQDFSNALTAVSGYARSVLDDLSESHPAHISATGLVKSVESASEMTRQLAVFSRRRSVYSATVDLNKLLWGLEGALRRIARPEVAITIATSETPVLVQADPVHLEQIAVSLAFGARRVIAGPGAMEVRTETADCFATLSMRCIGCCEDAEPFGVSTIQAIVSQYGGTVTEERNEDTLLVSVLIPEAR